MSLKILSWGTFKTPLGWSAAAWTDKGLAVLVLPEKSRVSALRKLHSYLPKVNQRNWEEEPSAVPHSIRKATLAALQGKRFSYSTFDLQFLTPFQTRILQATRAIPLGGARSYAWVARKAGSPKGFQAAGQALTRNPIPLLIPCHRVIAGQNKLGGYGSGLPWKINLLKKEGLGVVCGREGSYRVSGL